jgi:putative DNA methylase
MERLQGEGVRGADLVFACIGPALEIFSRYSKVETVEGSEVGLPEYLKKVWEVVGRTALEQVLGTAEAQARNGLAGVLEEDARLSALFLWTHQSTEGIAPNNGNGSGTAAEDDEAPDEDEEDDAPKRKPKGLTLIFDVVRRFAQPLGIRLPDWEGRIIETKKGVVRLLPVKERVKQLFGEPGAGAVADEIELSPRAAAQLTLFAEERPAVRGRDRRRGSATTVAAGELESSLEATTLDRVHAAMLLQASGRSQALRNLLKAEQDRGPDFLRLANALSALYPRGSEEKRLLDAMLLAVPR